MSAYDWAGLAANPSAGLDVRLFHDGWLYPHGRTGYGPTEEQIAAAKAACPFCTKTSASNRTYAAKIVV
jgi:hypothetical protein